MQGQDALKDFADTLRAKGGVEARTAVLGGHRVEFVRGKDVLRWIDAHPEKASRFCSKGKALLVGNTMMMCISETSSFPSGVLCFYRTASE